MNALEPGEPQDVQVGGVAPPIDLPSDLAMLGEPQQTTWPNVIGAISIVYAVLGLLCQAAAIGFTLLGEWMMSLGGMDVQYPEAIKIAAIISAAVMTCLGLLLLVGGVAVVRRRRSGIARLKAWALLRVVLVVVGLGVNVTVLAPAQLEMARQMREAGNQKLREQKRSDLVQEFDPDTEYRKIMITTGVTSGVTVVYPLFLTFFLSRRRITDEIETWA